MIPPTLGLTPSPPPLRIVVVDDEAPARARLRRLLVNMPGVEVVGDAADGEAAVDTISELSPNLVLLDIQMPRLDGFGLVEAMGDDMPLTVFCTAFDAHALAAFEARAVDYLLKPVQHERLVQACERARTLLAGTRTGVQAGKRRGLRAITDIVEADGRPLTRLLVRDGTQAYLLPTNQIDHIRADRNHCELHTGERVFRVRRTLASLVGRLDPDTFLQINKSDVVRLDAIREIQPWSHGDYRVVLRSGRTLSWSRRFRAAAGE